MMTVKLPAMTSPVWQEHAKKEAIRMAPIIVNMLAAELAKTIEGMDYIYLGDRMTDSLWKGTPCKAVRRKDGKCIRGRNGSMLVEFSCGTRSIIIGRLLRKIK